MSVANLTHRSYDPAVSECIGLTTNAARVGRRLPSALNAVVAQPWSVNVHPVPGASKWSRSVARSPDPSTTTVDATRPETSRGGTAAVPPTPTPMGMVPTARTKSPSPPKNMQML